jgi:hypothetical protein
MMPTKEDEQTKIILKIQKIVNKSKKKIEIGPILYHCEPWRINPKPVASIIITSKEGIKRKIGKMEINN